MKHTNFYDEFFLKKTKQKPTINKNILFNETIREFEKHRNNRIKDNYRMLDIGCGPGHLIGKLLSRYQNLEITGCDITSNTLSILRDIYPQVNFYQKDFSEEVLLENKYDVITAVEVIEHIPYSKQKIFIENCSNLLTEDGILILTTPNKDKLYLMPKKYRATQPIEDWINIEETTELLGTHFSDITVETRLMYLPNILLDAIYKRLFYFFHNNYEQRLLSKTTLGAHIIATATNLK